MMMKKVLRDELLMLWDVTCPECGSEILNKNGKYRSRQRFVCLDCGHSFTTYSKSILHATKLPEEAWESIITGVINGQPLRQIAADADVSMISTSKIRRNILRVLYPLSRFRKALDDYFYDPENTGSYFMPDQEQRSVYYMAYRSDLWIMFLSYHGHMFVSDCYDGDAFHELKDSPFYPQLTFVPLDEADNPEADEYISGLLAFLKSFRGIKHDWVGPYCNFYDFRRYLTPGDLYDRIIEEISHYKRKKGNG
jgi:transposase-like protein